MGDAAHLLCVILSLDSAVMPGIVTMETAAQQTLLLAAFIYAQNK
jgi:hypothetical protein